MCLSFVFITMGPLHQNSVFSSISPNLVAKWGGQLMQVGFNFHVTQEDQEGE